MLKVDPTVILASHFEMPFCRHLIHLKIDALIRLQSSIIRITLNSMNFKAASVPHFFITSFLIALDAFHHSPATDRQIVSISTDHSESEFLTIVCGVDFVYSMTFQ